MSKWIVVGSVLLAITGAAVAAPVAPVAPVDRKPSADEQKHYGAALKRARDAENAGNLKAAAKAFNDCLQILPDDPVALGELGVVQLRANQLADAEATSRKAIEHSQSPNVRAAALFNLGYILAKRGDKPGAIDAYQSSLRLRVNTTVEAELRKLDPQAATAVRFVPRPMHPAAADTATMLKERCWKAVADAWPELQATAADLKDEHISFSCSDTPSKLALDGTPILETRVLSSSSTYSQYPKLVLSLAIRTAQGWFTAPLEAVWVNRWGDAELKLTGVELITLGTQQAIVVHWDTTFDEWPWDSDPAQAYPNTNPEGRVVIDHEIAIASIGLTGTPSMTPAITVGFTAGFGNPRTPLVNAMMQPSFTAGALELSAPVLQPTKVPHKKYADLLDRLITGKLELGFP